MDLSTFFREIGLEHLYPIFTDNGIDDIASLQQLSSETSEAQSFIAICPLIGNRLKIKKKLNSINQLINISDSISVSSEVSSLLSVQPFTPFYVSNVPVEPSSSSLIEPFESPAKKNKHSHLQNILEQTIIGKAILAFYVAHKELDNKTQAYLCEIIVCHYLNKEPILKLTNEDFDEISRDIVKIFPNEVKEVYYTPPIKKRHSKNHKAGISRGKLVDKYRNKLTFLRKAGILSSKQTLICALLPSRSNRKSKIHWQPTPDEVRDGIIVHVKVPADVEITIENRKKKLGKNSVT